MARPQKTLKDLPENWQNIILDERSAGASLAEMYGKLGISQSLHRRFMQRYAEYKRVNQEGDIKCEAWWMEQGRKHLFSRNFSANLWYMNMRNRFGWTDRKDVTSGDKPVQSGIILLPPKRPALTVTAQDSTAREIVQPVLPEKVQADSDRYALRFPKK